MKLSIITPTYNRPMFMELLLKNLSTLNFKYETELIIINDGGREFIFKNLDIKNLSFKIINLKENSGCVSIPRNIGIINSSGEYIMHQDDDCLMYDNKFELINLLDNNHDATLAYGVRENIHLNGQRYIVQNPDNYNPLNMWGIDGSQFVYRRSVYTDLKVPIHFAKRGCDWRLMQQIWNKKSSSFISLNKVVSGYIWHNENRSLDNNTKTKQIDIDNFKNYFTNNNYEYNFEVINAD